MLADATVAHGIANDGARCGLRADSLHGTSSFLSFLQKDRLMHRTFIVGSLIAFIFPFVMFAGCGTEDRSSPSGESPQGRTLRITDRGAPALWLADFDGHKMYLFGTFHLGVEGADWFNSRIAEAFEASQTTIFEVNKDAMQSVEATGKVLTAQAAHGKLSDQLAPQTWKRTRQLADTLDVPVEALEMVPPFMGAMVLQDVFWKQLGIHAEFGVDDFLIEKSAAQSKHIAYLETPNQQIDALLGIPQDVQLEYFAKLVNDPSAAKNQSADLWERWYEGDVEKASDMEVELRSSKSMRALTSDRNKRWLPILEQHAHDNIGSSFVAIGLLHLLGPEGLPSLLQQAGVNCQRIEY